MQANIKTHARSKTLSSPQAESLLFTTSLVIMLSGLLAPADAQTTKSAGSKGHTITDKTNAAPPQIDKQAIGLLRRNQQAMYLLTAYAVECRTTEIRQTPKPGFYKREYEVATLVAQKPNKMRYEQWYLHQDNQPTANWMKPVQWMPNTAFTCDGTSLYQQFGHTCRISKLVAPRYMHTLLEPWNGFYDRESSPLGDVERAAKAKTLQAVRREGRADVGGVMCEKVFVHYGSSYAGNSIDNQITWYFGSDGLTRRCVNHVSTNAGNGFTNDSVFVNLRTNELRDAASYAYTPPQGVKLETEPPQIPLLTNGTVAPDFSGQDKDNKPVRLADLQGKVVILDFWASWCGPCNAAMPHSQVVLKKLLAEGLPVVLLAVDNADTRVAFDDWIKRRSAEFPTFQFVFVPTSEALSRQYRATTIPTQYVVDKSGVIRASFVGYGGATNDLEKAVRATLLADAGKSPSPVP